MMYRVRLAAASGAALLALPLNASGQVAYDSPAGRVEVLGLKRWNLAMLQDSIRRYVPGQNLHDAACMVTLRDSLRFAEASVEHFEMAAPGAPRRSFLTIKLIEPQDAARVQWDSRPRNAFSSLLPDYASLIVPLTDSVGGLRRGRLLYWLQFSDTTRRREALTRVPASARRDGDRVFGFLAKRTSEGDRRRAMRVLEQDGFWVNRMAAVTVLSNYATHDSTWWVLVRALRDPHEGVREAAGAVLGALPSRPVDWRSAAADLRLLLGGTNLSAMERVFDILARTQVAPELAPHVLRDNTDWVLDHLAAETPMAADAAHRLLVRLNGGRDLGARREAWAAWAQKL